MKSQQNIAPGIVHLFMQNYVKLCTFSTLNIFYMSNLNVGPMKWKKCFDPHSSTRSMVNASLRDRNTTESRVVYHYTGLVLFLECNQAMSINQSISQSINQALFTLDFTTDNIN